MCHEEVSARNRSDRSIVVPLPNSTYKPLDVISNRTPNKHASDPINIKYAGCLGFVRVPFTYFSCNCRRQLRSRIALLPPLPRFTPWRNTTTFVTELDAHELNPLWKTLVARKSPISTLATVTPAHGVRTGEVFTCLASLRTTPFAFPLMPRNRGRALTRCASSFRLFHTTANYIGSSFHVIPFVLYLCLLFWYVLGPTPFTSMPLTSVAELITRSGFLSSSCSPVFIIIMIVTTTTFLNDPA